MDDDDTFTLPNLLFTLDLCERCLPSNAHVDHKRRLREIRRILQDRADATAITAVLRRPVELMHNEVSRG